jgi:hypothetical protein
MLVFFPRIPPQLRQPYEVAAERADGQQGLTDAVAE